MPGEAQRTIEHLPEARLCPCTGEAQVTSSYMRQLWALLLLLPCLGCSWQPAPRTFLRLRPWEMLSAVMNAASRCVMAPASPQCGRNRNVFIPRCLAQGRSTQSRQTARLGGWTQLQAQLCPYHESPGIQLDLGAHCSFSFLLCVCNR